MSYAPARGRQNQAANGQTPCETSRGMTEPMMKTTNIDRRTDHLSCEAALTFRECDKWTDLLSVTFRIQTKGQTSRETTEPATKTPDPNKRTDLLGPVGDVRGILRRQRDRPLGDSLEPGGKKGRCRNGTDPGIFSGFRVVRRLRRLSSGDGLRHLPWSRSSRN